MILFLQKAKTVYANMNNRLNFSYIEYLYGEDLELEINNLLTFYHKS